MLAHDLEAGSTRSAFVGVRADLHIGDDLGAALADVYDWRRRPATACIPVHAVAARHRPAPPLRRPARRGA